MNKEHKQSREGLRKLRLETLKQTEPFPRSKNKKEKRKKLITFWGCQGPDSGGKRVNAILRNENRFTSETRKPNKSDRPKS